MILHKVNLLISDTEILVSTGGKYHTCVYISPSKSLNEKDFIICGYAVDGIKWGPSRDTDKQIWLLRNGKVIDEKYASMLLRYIIKRNSPWYLRRVTEFTLFITPNFKTRDLQTLKRCCGNFRVKFICKPIAYLRQLNVTNGIVISMEGDIVSISVIENDYLIRTSSDSAVMYSMIQSLKNWLLNKYHTKIGEAFAFHKLKEMLKLSDVILYGPDDRTCMPNKIKLSFRDYAHWLDEASQSLREFIMTSLYDIIKENHRDIYFCGDIETSTYLKDCIIGENPELNIILQENTTQIILDGNYK